MLRLDFGEHPISNRFLPSKDAAEFKQRWLLSQCVVCGLVQLITLVPAEELRPRHPWITYREPEGHLDQLAADLCQLPGISPSSSFLGVSYKDDTLLGRIQRLGFARTGRIDAEADLGVSEPGAGVETIQDRLQLSVVEWIRERHGLADVIIARHILEHAYDLREFIWTLKSLLRPEGYLVIEVPDCQAAMDRLDYTMPWEEHIAYFTERTLLSTVGFQRLQLTAFKVFPNVLESSLVVIAQAANGTADACAPVELGAELDRMSAYAAGFGPKTQRLRALLRDMQPRKVAGFGAGHLTCAFLNLHQLADLVEFVVDDHPNKVGLWMPGSRLPIRASKALAEEGIGVCLLGLSPESEGRVIENQQAFTIQGGTFASILPGSPRALPA